MRKYLAAGILAVFVLFLSSKSATVPLDVPNDATAFSLTTSTGVILSSGTLKNFAYPYQWCISHLVVSTNAAESHLRCIFRR